MSITPELYRAAREGAACAELTDRGRIVLHGADRRDYLHGLLTNDIQALTAGTGCYAAYLTPQGRMISDMRVFELGDAILVDLPASTRQLVLDRLDQFLFSEDVQLADVTDVFAHVRLAGPLAPRVAAQALDSSEQDLSGLAPFGNRRVDLRGETAIVARADEYELPGLDIWIPRAAAAATMDGLARAGAARGGEDLLEILRVEAGVPRFGADMTDDTIPLEAGIEDRAISFTKGCYVGQEVIVRVLHRGHGRVARRLVGLVLEAGSAASAGDAIYAGDKPIGSITSAIVSPALGRPIALGYVHRDYVEPGTAIEIDRGGMRTPAVVTALPFVKPSSLQST